MYEQRVGEIWLGANEPTRKELENVTTGILISSVGELWEDVTSSDLAKDSLRFLICTMGAVIVASRKG